MSFFKTLFVSFIVFIQFSCSAQESSLLWEISGNGLEKPSYLYGTIHIKDKRAFDFGDSVDICLKASDAFATEISMAELKSPLVFQSLIAKKGGNLNQILSEDEYKEFAATFKEITGQDVAPYNNFKPFLHYSLLAASLFESEMPMVVDEYLSNEAAKLNKPLLSVEKIETQLKLLDLITKKELLEFVHEKDSIIQIMNLMIEAYANKDIQKIEELINQSTDKENEKMMKQMLYDRNKTMSIAINKMIKKQSIFIAIGAGHLPKENGVIALLQQEGYIVRPIN